MIVAHISDTHIAVPSAEGRPVATRIENLKRCVAAINRLRPPPLAVVHTGDLTQNGTAAEYALVRRLLAPLTVPLYVVPGNRDRREALRAAFAADGYLAADSDFLHYAVECDGVRLVALDSVMAGRGHGGLCCERLAWLDAALAASRQQPTAILLHHPPLDDDHGPLAGFVDAGEAAAFAALLARHTHVQRVLCGHAHLAAEVALGGTLLGTAPCVALDLRRDGGPTGPEAAPMISLHCLEPGSAVTGRSRLITT